MDSKLSRWCDGLIEAGWLAAVIAAPLFFNIHSDRVFEPDKLTLIRSIALIMSAAWLAGFIDRQGWRDWRRLTWRNENSVWRMPFVLPVFLLVVIYLLSTLFSVTPRVSWAGSYQRLQGTYTTLSYITIFALTLLTMRSRAQLRRVVTAVIVTSIPVSFYGLLQHFALDPLPWGGNVTIRVAGHMGNAIFIAAYLIMAVPLTVARIIDAFTSILGDEELAYADVVRSSVYIFTLSIQLIAIYWSGSRGPWIGLAAALFAFVLIVLVTLRDAAPGAARFRLAEGGRALALALLGTGSAYLILRLLINGLAGTGRFPALAGAGGSFAAFAAAVVLVVIVIFIMIAARRGWRWLWASWLLLTLILGGWLAAFNFAPALHERLSGTPILGDISETLVSWQDLSAIGRLGRLLESESGTGKVRLLIWQGTLKLLSLHQPLQLPDGEQDSFNFLRPLLGYGPESMYVAYNRFYPPELATVEARNASPDRSHNETFDALVITGVLGFLVWQALYLSVFYYGFHWLRVVRSRRDRYLFIAFWIGGAIVATLVVTRAMGLALLGVAIPLGTIIGLVLYLVYYALFIPAEGGQEPPADPFQIDRLLMIGLVAAVLAHYVEIHFGIAIAATRVHFFVYVALMFILGYWLPQLKAAPEQPAPVKGKGRARRRRLGRGGDGLWGPALLSGLTLALILGILGYEYITYSLPPDKVIESPADLTAGDIFRQSFLQNASKEFADSPFLYLMMMLTWSLGTLVVVSEMSKQGELRFRSSDGRLDTGRRQTAAVTYLVVIVFSLAYRFWLSPAAADLSTTQLLGRSLLLIWIGLCAWAAVRLFSGRSGHRLLAGAVAMAGLLLSLPVIVAGGTWPGLIIAAFCLFILYLMWDEPWSAALVPAADLSFLALSAGVFYGYVQASLLRATLFFQASQAAGNLVQTRLAEVEQSTVFLIMFYIFAFVLLLLAAFAASWNDTSRLRQGGTIGGYAALLVLLVAAIVAVNQSNMRIVQADVIYKRAKPFDANATVSRNPADWDVAIAIYERAIELVPQEDFYYLFLGRAYLEQSTVTTDLAVQTDLLSRAETRLIEAQTINPLNTDHTANLARLNTRWVQLSSDEEDRQSRLEKAERYYRDALALSPQNSIIRNEYARLAYDLKGDCDQAIELYDDSVRIDPFYAISYFGQAEIYQLCANQQPESERLAYVEKAAESFESGLEIDDQDVRVWLQLAQAYQQLGRYEKSLDAYSEARIRNSGNQIPEWNIDYWEATAYLDMDDKAMAQQLGLQALAAAPPDAGVQIQAFLSQFTDISQLQPPPAPAEGERRILSGDRVLASLPPAERNNYYSQPPPMVIDPSKAYEAIMYTEKGQMRFQLFDDESPLAVNNFVFLAGQGFYDGTTFHRVLADFMAQGGDPSGTGGGGPGYQFADEVNNGLGFDRRGLLAMANAGTDTNGSQFFITFGPTPHLNGRHTIFGQLLEGDETLSALTLRDPATNPAEPGDLIERIDIVEITP